MTSLLAWWFHPSSLFSARFDGPTWFIFLDLKPPTHPLGFEKLTSVCSPFRSGTQPGENTGAAWPRGAKDEATKRHVDSTQPKIEVVFYMLWNSGHQKFMFKIKDQDQLEWRNRSMEHLLGTSAVAWSHWAQWGLPESWPGISPPGQWGGTLHRGVSWGPGCGSLLSCHLEVKLVGKDEKKNTERNGCSMILPPLPQGFVNIAIKFSLWMKALPVCSTLLAYHCWDRSPSSCVWHRHPKGCKQRANAIER